jgi:hypothetical protein
LFAVKVAEPAESLEPLGRTMKLSRLKRLAKR